MPVTVCLNMIVKNEAPVIRRCLDSVRPFIDRWVIVDTGSTDGTQDIIREHLADIPGELHERPWRDFAHNRTEALELARGQADYLLFIDADETLRAPGDFARPALGADAYFLHCEYGGTIYSRCALVSTRLAWRWVGVLHEYLTSTPEAQKGHLDWPRIVVSHDGARARDPETYRKDAVILERALLTETDSFLMARYTFYLAQSYRDLGEKQKSIEAYLRRAELGHWDQEVFYSLYQAAKLEDELGHDRDEVIALYLRASEATPGRAEALHGASRLCRLAGRNQEGYEIARRGLALTAPVDGLFVEPWIYDYGLLDEYAVNAYWSGRYLDSLDACIKLLSNPACPAEHRARFTANARFALDKLPRMSERAGFAPFGRPGGQHQLGPARELHSLRMQGETPKVLLAILAKQKEPMLSLFLRCIEALEYPKSSIVIYIRTNNNKDRTHEMLSEWVERVRPCYAAVEMDASDVPERVETFGVHEWNAERFKVLGRIRNVSLRKTLEYGCAYYFTADVDNFIRPCTLKELVALSLPIVAPLLRSVDETSRYSNYHADIDSNGYFRDCQQYDWILSQAITGVFELPVVHCTYLIRSDVIPALDYDDRSARHEYVIFSERARRNGIPQYYDNRQLYGYLTLDDDRATVERAARLLADDLDLASRSDGPAITPLNAGEGRVDRVLERFRAIYRDNEWGYGSGVGSLPSNNIQYMELVQSFLEKERIESVVDFGCGDWQFSRFMDWKGATYVGLDLVPDLIETNRKAFERPGVLFKVFGSLDDVPAADLLLCKDVFQHLPNETVREYLAAFKRKARFLLITNDDQPDVGLNSNIQIGGWRPVRLDYPPFSERALVLLSWMISAGGWKPTRKSTFLIEGRPRT